jgi:hypothetical protein
MNFITKVAFIKGLMGSRKGQLKTLFKRFNLFIAYIVPLFLVIVH